MHAAVWSGVLCHALLMATTGGGPSAEFGPTRAEMVSEGERLFVQTFRPNADKRGGGDGLLVLGNARDENRSRDPVAFELLRPPRGERSRVLRRELERKLLPERFGRLQPRRQSPEELVGEEMRVGIGDG